MAKKTPAEAIAEGEAAGPKTRRKLGPKGHLAAKVREVVDAFVTGEIVLEKGKYLTPHRISVLIAERAGGERPSTGAVKAVLDRWVEYGAITVHEKPFAFKAFTAKAKKVGVQGIIDERAAARKKETEKRQAAIKAEKAAAREAKAAEKAKAKAEADAAKAAAKAEAAEAAAKAEAEAAEAAKAAAES